MSEWISLEGAHRPANEAAVAKFELRVGARLPDEYRQFLLEVNGGYLPVTHKVVHLGRIKAVINSLYTLDSPEEQSDLWTRQVYRTYDAPPATIEIGYDDSGCPLLMPLVGEHAGEVWYLDILNPRPSGANPRVDWFDRRDAAQLAESLHTFLDGLEPLQ